MTTLYTVTVYTATVDVYAMDFLIIESNRSHCVLYHIMLSQAGIVCCDMSSGTCVAIVTDSSCYQLQTQQH